MRHAAIIGCGYLGSKIASLLSKKKWHVTATTRRTEKLKDLAKVAQKGVIFKSGNIEELAHLINTNEIIIVTIAAEKRELYESVYLHTAEMIKSLALQNKTPKWLIYTSSTSVYGDHNGMWVDETSPLLASSQAGKCLIDTENTYLSLRELGWQVTILRAAEIYGPGRETSQRLKMVEGGVLPGVGNHYTNMIHLDDSAAAVDYAISHQLEGIYNLSDDDHPTRLEFYNAVAEKFGLTPVKWDETLFSQHSGNKRVSNHKIKAAGFTFQHAKREFE